MSLRYGIILAGILAQIVSAQTQVNLQTQARAVDFSAAPSTKPAQTGTVLPAGCSTGAVFVLLSNPPGQNVYVCTGSGNWSLQGGAGLALNVLSVTASGGTLTIGGNCSASSPCNVRVGATVFAFVNAMTATLTSGPGSAYVYVSSSGTMTVGHNMTVTCAGGCVAQAGITAFPPDAYPIAIWTAASTAWSASGVDVRAPLGRDLVVAGTGLTTSYSATSTSVSAPSQEGGFSVAFRGTDVSAGSTIYLTVPYSCTITDWAVSSDSTATIMLWRVADGGTSLPNDGDSLNANGFSLTTGTKIHSTVLTDLQSTSISAFDTFGVNLFAVGSPASHVEFYLGCAR